MKTSEEKLSSENQKLLEENNHYIIQLEEESRAQMKEISLKRPSPVQTKLNLEKEYKKINEELKMRINPLEIENEQLKKSLREANDKYESLRDIDSPVKEVSQMKKLLKQNDSNIEVFKQENMNLLLKLKSFDELKIEFDRIEIENAQLKKTLNEINQKYESIRDIDSPVKEVSMMKKLMKQNDSNIEGLKEENTELLAKTRSIEPLKIEISQLKNTLQEITEKYESLRDIDSPIKEVSQMKKLVKQNDANIQTLKKENTNLKIKLQVSEESSMQFEDSKSLVISLEKENIELKYKLNDIKDKYESLRDLDSPVKEVSQMKKILKENDKKVELLLKEKEELKESKQQKEQIMEAMYKQIAVLETKIQMNSDNQEKYQELNVSFNEKNRKYDEIKKLMLQNDDVKIVSLIKKNEELEKENLMITSVKEENSRISEENKTVIMDNKILQERISEISDNYEIVKSINLENPDFEPLIKKISELKQKNDLLTKENYEEKEESIGLRTALNNLKTSEEKLSSENQNLLEENNRFIIHMEEEPRTQIKEISSPLKIKINLEKEYKNIIEELKARINPLEIENDQMKKSLLEINEKYEGLRDMDSPIKEVSQMKKLLKQNDSNIEVFKQENMNLLIKLKSFEEMQVKFDKIEIENSQLKDTLNEINQKYESLRDIDSPIKEVSHMKKLMKQNDTNIAALTQENNELLLNIRSIEPLKIENLQHVKPKKSYSEIKNHFDDVVGRNYST